MPETFGVANLEITAKKPWGALCQVVVRIADIDSKYQQLSALKVKTKLFRREEAQVPKNEEHSGNIGNQKIGGKFIKLCSPFCRSQGAKLPRWTSRRVWCSSKQLNKIKYEISTILNFEKEGEQKVIDVVIFDDCGTWDLTTEAKLTAKIKLTNFTEVPSNSAFTYILKTTLQGHQHLNSRNAGQDTFGNLPKLL
jgi:hypothetical protein